MKKTKATRNSQTKAIFCFYTVQSIYHTKKLNMTNGFTKDPLFSQHLFLIFGRKTNRTSFFLLCLHQNTHVLFHFSSPASRLAACAVAALLIAFNEHSFPDALKKTFECSAAIRVCSLRGRRLFFFSHPSRKVNKSDRNSPRSVKKKKKRERKKDAMA